MTHEMFNSLSIGRIKKHWVIPLDPYARWLMASWSFGEFPHISGQSCGSPRELRTSSKEEALSDVRRLASARLQLVECSNQTGRCRVAFLDRPLQQGDRVTQLSAVEGGGDRRRPVGPQTPFVKCRPSDRQAEVGQITPGRIFGQKFIEDRWQGCAHSMCSAGPLCLRFQSSLGCRIAQLGAPHAGHCPHGQEVDVLPRTGACPFYWRITPNRKSPIRRNLIGPQRFSFLRAFVADCLQSFTISVMRLARISNPARFSLRYSYRS
jgi:hypothetical protein